MTLSFIGQLKPKFWFAGVGLASAGLLGFGFFLQYVVTLTPCPLCIAQRFFYALNLLLAAGAWCFARTARSARFFGIGISLASLFGALIAGRHVWLQHTVVVGDPTQCNVFFGSYLHSLLLALGGVGNCVTVDWTFLTLSIAEWSLLWFLLLLGIGLRIVFHPDGRAPATNSATATVAEHQS